MINTIKIAFKSFCSAGAKGEIHGVAATQQLHSNQNETGYVLKVKKRLLDRGLDRVVEISGSQTVFFIINIILLAWALCGIKFGRDINWQVLISDAQAILTYVFDSFLMRQQLNGYDNLLVVSAQLRSRNESIKRMLRILDLKNHHEEIVEAVEVKQLPATDDDGEVAAKTSSSNLVEEVGDQLQLQQQTEFDSVLPQENWLGKLSTYASKILGHIVSVLLFWVGIIIWIGFGKSQGWSNQWELYINSATSALMVFVFAFLANIRERHAKYTALCLDPIYKVDSALELKLRELTGDQIPNPIVVIPPQKVGKIQRVIYFYADVVGTLVGIMILIIVLVIWIVIGPTMHFSSNWWLIIGTYAGLIGMNDGFVLRNVHHNLRHYEDTEFDKVSLEDASLYQILGIPFIDEEENEIITTSTFSTLSYRVSVFMGNFCSHRYTVFLGVVTIIGLVIGSSAMKWDTTGQLLSNIPPSIIESFFMIILITGHNISEERRRNDLRNLYLRRLRIFNYVKNAQPLINNSNNLSLSDLSDVERDARHNIKHDLYKDVLGVVAFKEAEAHSEKKL